MPEYITVGQKVMQLQDENAALQVANERLRKALHRVAEQTHGKADLRYPMNTITRVHHIARAALAQKGE